MTAQPYPDKPILLIDDEPAWLRTMSIVLETLGRINHLQTCSDSRQARDLLRGSDYSLVLLDLNIPHLDGENLLAEIRQEYPTLPVVIITAVDQVETAVRCVKAGALDFFVKTDDSQRIVSGIERVLQQTIRQQNQQKIIKSLLHSSEETDAVFADFNTRSPKMHQVFAYLKAIAESHESLLISGESGTGKELVARTIWKLQGQNRPWVAVNVAGLDDIVFSDTLFGHQPGAFTGADGQRSGMIQQAADGVLFLDEIGDLSSASQVKLLRLLEEREYYPLGSDQPQYLKARIVAATNRDLNKQQATGQFRRDLLHRLNTHHVIIPSLRQRQEDIPPLVDFFVAEAAQKLNKPVPSVSPALHSALERYSFPGNVRELRALIYDALYRHERGSLSVDDLKPELREIFSGIDDPSEADPTLPNEVSFPAQLPTLKRMTNLLIDEALRRCQNNQTQAAQLLGLSQQALNYRMRNR